MNRTSEKVMVPNGRGEELAARFERPAGTSRAVCVFAHCFTCSKDIAAATRISRGLTLRGFSVLRFDFTGLGGSGGDFANTHFSSNVADLLAVVEHLRSGGEAPRLLIGHSLGGAAVLSAAHAVPEAVGVVTIGAPSSPDHLRHIFLDQEADIRSRGEARVRIAGREFTVRKEFLEDIAEHPLRERIRALGKALLVLHAPEDEIVELEHARRIYAAAEHPKSFLALDGADHLLTRSADSEYVAEVVAAWASRYLPAPTPEPVRAEGSVVVAEREGGLAQDILAGSHALAADEPVALGGTDTGPTPYALLLAGLGACTSMTLRMYARRKDWPLESVRVELDHAKIHATDCENCETAEGRIDRIERTVTLVGDLTQEQRGRLLEIADRCPVHRTLESEVSITTREG